MAENPKSLITLGTEVFSGATLQERVPQWYVTDDAMSRINSNIEALRAIRRLGVNQQDLHLRLERLSTGLRINRGSDDPAGLIISETLRNEVNASRQAIANSARANNVIAVAEGALNETSALLLELQALVISTANQSGITDEEVYANQLAIDSILTSVDRIGQTTTFGNRKLLDGSLAYLTSGVPPASVASLALFSARISEGGTQAVTVRVTQSARPAEVSFIGTTPGGISRTEGTTIEIRGALGAELLSFASGTTLAEVRTAINGVATATGVSAIISAATGVASAVVLSSTTLGSDAFISVTPIAGDFVQNNNANIEARGAGADAGVLVNGQPASVKGLRADVRGNGLDARFHLTQTFGQTPSSVTFTITGGGALFQISPEVSPNGQLFAGLERISTTDLGNAVTGLLYSLRSGETNDLDNQNFERTQNIVDEAIDQVASYRGRLGTIQRSHLQPAINSLGVALENLTASESVIRDADIAVETSALTRAQILVQSTQTVLRIANSVPQDVLALLQ